MKVLLLGDFSSLHTHLAQGLRELGHDVQLYSNGDGWKKIPGNFRRLSAFDKANSLLLKVGNLLYQLILVLRLGKYDIIQIINPYIFSNSRLANYFFSILRRKSGSFAYIACGTDPYYIKSAESLDYFTMSTEDCALLFNRKDDVRINAVLRNVDIVIPSAYDYYVGYRGEIKNLGCPLFLPVEIIDFAGLDYDNKQPLRIYHGITRPKFKGSDYFTTAMKKLKANYPNDVELVIKEKLSYTEFLDELKDCHVFLDQCNSYGYGMNAVLAASFGKIVLTGAEDAALGYLDVKSACPFINAKPDSDQIYEELEKLVGNNREWYLEQSKAHYNYVLRFHDRNKVAAQFINVLANHQGEK